ncbi:hypothetical protein GPECTOR_6g881 [Gonium pectorale]|uniref:N-acetyltransferase domain-containing protein n=1 Tax=Gonium pectorale TaxID=33097 RepID=A0A150GW70_GONPE|nr:hypothetical protein GPECTOR_6g881 [Gonium pectorale]|eukprot:KXZ53962.1 hypothetical protein GPECTOR_6g881 [Gonium pectorale]
MWACLVAYCSQHSDAAGQREGPGDACGDSGAAGSPGRQVAPVGCLQCQLQPPGLSPQEDAPMAPSVVAGYVLLSLSQPLAVLPPPLPSRAPQQVHVDALAVAPAWRGRGVATALLDAAERLARRWGRASLWLHVDAANEPAVRLYTDRGYSVARVQHSGVGLGGLLGAVFGGMGNAGEHDNGNGWLSLSPLLVRGAVQQKQLTLRRHTRRRAFVMQKCLHPPRNERGE